MSTSQTIKTGHRKGFTLIEMLIVLVILGVLVFLASFNSSLEKERNARINLKLAYQAEKDAFAYSTNFSTSELVEGYADSWDKLLCGDLNAKDSYFSYTLEVPVKSQFNITATSRRDPSRYFIINQDGVLKDNAGTVYK